MTSVNEDWDDRPLESWEFIKQNRSIDPEDFPENYEGIVQTKNEKLPDVYNEELFET